VYGLGGCGWGIVVGCVDVVVMAGILFLLFFCSLSCVMMVAYIAYVWLGGRRCRGVDGN